ncbi:MAG: hypothetical protein KA187_00540 [Arenimonas sp.]|nr:hypothetical protein [Arenimonas sp.]MBP6625881.1 hypothetical protein [Arenimonas sp.]
MSLADKVAAVARCETLCLQQRATADAALAHLKTEFRRGATPLRIVLSGFSLGVAAGVGVPGTGALASAGGRFVTGPLFSLVLESVLPGLLAGVTAAATAEAEGANTADEPDAP